MVRCKFTCQSVTMSVGYIYKPAVGSERKMVYSYEFSVVTADSPENAVFFASTPSGSLKVTAIKNDLFIPGKEYYLDLSEAQQE